MSDAKDKCLNCAAELPELICPECRRFVDAWSKWIIASENAKALGRDLAAAQARIAE